MSTLKEMVRTQARLLLEKATIEGKGEFKDPPLDLAAIRARADRLDPKDPIKADIYLLCKSIEKAAAHVHACGTKS